MSTPIRVVGTLLLVLCLLATGCMRAKLEREWRRPWSWQTSVVEDAIWTVETAALETAKVIGGMALAIVTFGLLNPFDDEGDDEEDDGDGAYGGYVPNTAPTYGSPPPPPSSNGRRVQGTRRQR